MSALAQSNIEVIDGANLHVPRAWILSKRVEEQTIDNDGEDPE